MNILLFLPLYLRWHYTKSLKDLYENLKSWFLFIPQFFSLPVLFKTLFSPWKRLSESYHTGFDPEAFFSTFVVNSILRVVGFFVRFLTIITAIILEVLFVIFSFGLYIFWLIFPLFLVFILALVFKNLF